MENLTAGKQNHYYMKQLIAIISLIGLVSCKQERPFEARDINEVEIETFIEDSTLSVRAMAFDTEYLYYGSSNHFGKRAFHGENKIDLTKLEWSDNKDHIKYYVTNNSDSLSFRAISVVNETMFAISIGNPARLYKLSRKSTKPVLVYEEQNDKVFYDSMDFWNEQEGIAIGDPTDNCMSIIITRDGGNTWNKISCDDLPKAKDGEAAFAASDTNIAIVGDNTWVATGGKASRILYSPDKGITWEVFETPIVQGLETTGMYSIDFYDEFNGFAIGGDYTKPDDNAANKIRTQDGGKTWELVAQGQEPGYRSCVQYIPNREGKELVAIGFNGINHSNDGGLNWKHLSDEGFYTIRFLNDSVAYAAAKGRISKLIFKE